MSICLIITWQKPVSIFISTYLTQVTRFVRLEIFWVSAVVCLWSDFYWQVLYEHTKKPRLKAPKYWPLPPQMIGMVSNRLVLPLALWYTGTESFLLFLSNMSCVAFGRHLKPFVLFILHVEKYCTLLAFSCVRLHHCCWHWDTLWVVWEEG